MSEESKPVGAAPKKLTLWSALTYLRIARDQTGVTQEPRNELHAYGGLVNGFTHHTIKHSDGQYVKGNIHTNTVEGFFAILKRGIVGTFHHVSRGHLHRYCDEFAFRYNFRQALGFTDGERAAQLVRFAEGKRLTFKQPSGTCAA